MTGTDSGGCGGRACAPPPKICEARVDLSGVDFGGFRLKL